MKMIDRTFLKLLMFLLVFYTAVMHFLTSPAPLSGIFLLLQRGPFQMKVDP